MVSRLVPITRRLWQLTKVCTLIFYTFKWEQLLSPYWTMESERNSIHLKPAPRHIYKAYKDRHLLRTGHKRTRTDTSWGPATNVQGQTPPEDRPQTASQARLPFWSWVQFPGSGGAFPPIISQWNDTWKFCVSQYFYLTVITCR
jgi:hypothetical protein